MNKKIMLIIVLITFSTTLWASPPPCTKWQVKVGAHEVQAYQRKDGTPVKGSEKETFCRLKFPKVEEWQDRFTDKMPAGWPIPNEKFKPWTQLEKEILLKWLSEQPKALRELKGITFLRGVVSTAHSKNPGAAVKRINAIALYDEFFRAEKKSAILSHELSHIYMYDLRENLHMEDLIFLMGWQKNEHSRLHERDKKIPLLKKDSEFDVFEDLANHFEVYLHNPNDLKNKNPSAFKKLSELVGTQFKLEK